MPADDDIIDDAVVRVSPDLTGFRRILQAALKKETAGVKATVKVKASADLVGFRTDLRNKLRAVDIGYKVKVEADARHLHTSIRKAVAQAKASIKDDTFTIKMDVDDRSARNTAQRALRFDANLDAQRTRATVNAERDRQRRLATLRKNTIGRERYGPKLIDLGGAGIRPMNLLYGAVAALSPLLLALGANAVHAASSIAALGAAGIGATLGITAVVSSLTRVREALKLREQARKQDLRSTVRAAKAEGGMADAIRDGMDRVYNARRSLRDANRAVADSERGLSEAQRDALESRNAITVAYREAKQELMDLRELVSDLALDEAEAAHAVEKSLEEQAKVSRNYWATDLERREAALDVARAQERLSDTQRERTTKTKELADAERKGLHQSNLVIEARERSADADRRVIDQQYALADAHRRVADSQRDVARAQRDLGRIRSGETSVGGAAANAAADELKERIAAMSPAARELYFWFDRNQGALDKLRYKMEQAVLPGFLTFMQEISDKGKNGHSSMTLMADAAAKLGGVIGKTVGRLGSETKNPYFRASMSKINKENAKSFELLGDATVRLVRPLMRITAAAAPLFTRFSQGMLDFANWFDRVIEKAEKSGDLARWFEQAGIAMGKWVDVGKNLTRFLLPVFQTSLPVGGTMLDRLRELTGTWADWANSNAGRQAMTNFFNTLRDLPYGQIVNLLQQMATTAVLWKISQAAIRHPFVAALTLLGAMDIAQAASVIDKVSSVLLKVASWVEQNPKTAATFLAILGALKIGSKVLEIGLTLPGLTSMKSWLLSKFGALAVGNKSAVMTVHAGVVNIMGGGIPGGKGVKGVPGVVPGAVGTGAAGAAGGLGTLVAGMAAAAVLGGISAYDNFGRGGKDEKFTDPMDRFWKDPGFITGMRSILSYSPVGLAAYLAGKGQAEADKKNKEAMAAGAREAKARAAREAASPYPTLDRNDPRNRSRPAVTRQRIQAGLDEAATFQRLNSFVQANTKEVQNNAEKRAVADRFLRDYLVTRKESVRAAAAEIHFAQGEAAAKAFLAQENEKTRLTTVNLLTAMTGNTKEAKELAFRTYGMGNAQQIAAKKADDLKAANERNRKATEKSKETAIRYDTVMKTLKTSIDKLTGKHVITLQVDGEELIFKSVENLLAYQHLLRTGKEATPAAMRQQKIYFEKARYATGGHVHGAGTATSDSIPAWLSNGEFVHPTDAVHHYGTQAMENIRKKRVPREALYAKGGQVGGGRRWPFPVNVKNTRTDFPTPEHLLPFTGGGKAVGSIKVARIAEGTARAMGASNKQLLALIEAGIVESGMRNLSYGDRDSVGFLQQRAGWGSKAQRMDVAHATRSFIRKAKQKDRKRYSAGQLAQAVQISAFPDRYDQREADAYAIINKELPGIPVQGMGGGFGKWPSSPGAQRGNSGVWRRLLAMVKASGIPHRFGNAYRHGDPLWHGSGRAIDFTGYNQDRLARFFMNMKSRVLELIHRTNSRDYGISRGRNANMGRQWPLHKDHLHVAMNKGGLAPTKYDTGGIIPPGLTLVDNQTRKPETLRNHEQERALHQGATMRLDRRDLALLAQAIVSALSGQQIVMDGRKVAEVIRGYDYLPRGI